MHAEVYPWLGEMRATGSGHSTDLNAGFAFEAEKPLHIIWDPAGTFMPEAHVYVDPVNGTNVAKSVTVAPTLAAARAGVRAASPSVAAQAIYLAARNVPAANGRPGSARAGDNAIITLAPGVHAFGNQAVSSGATTYQGRMIIQGDTDIPSSRDVCQLNTGDVPTWRYTLMLLRNLTLGVGAANLPFAREKTHMHDVNVTAKEGFESSNKPLFIRPATLLPNTITASSWRGTSVPMRGTHMYFGLVRGCDIAQPVGAPVVVGNVRTDPGHDYFYVEGVTRSDAPSTGADHMIWGNRFYSLRSRVLLMPVVSTGTRSGQLLRYRVVNNLFEMAGPRGGAFSGVGKAVVEDILSSMGEGVYVSASGCLLEGNTWVGQRLNWGYNDPPTDDPAYQNRHINNFVRNNYFDRSATKHDNFYDPKYKYRPGFTESWSILYGVGYERNCLGLRWFNTGDFKYEFDGLSAVVSPYPGHEQSNQWVKFRNDMSQFCLESGQTGGGDYSPAPGSPLIGAGYVACIDEDAFGTKRPSGKFAIGHAEYRKV